MYKFFFFKIIIFFCCCPSFLVATIEIWVKPSNLEYTAKIMCHGLVVNTAASSSAADQSKQQLIIAGGAVKAKGIGSPIIGPVRVEPDLSKCDPGKSTVSIAIETDNGKKRLYKIVKFALRRRRSPIVIGFGLAVVPMNKTFHLGIWTEFFVRMNSIQWELALNCFHFDGRNTKQFLTFGSAVQHKMSEKFVIIPVYESEAMLGCQNGGQMNVQLFYGKKEINFDISIEHLMNEQEFIIKKGHKTIKPLAIGQSSKSDDDDGAQAKCHLCKMDEAKVAFDPCGHFYYCCECSKKCKLNCPICRRKIESFLQIQMDSKDQRTTKCSICSQNQAECAFKPCGHYISCKECAVQMTKKGAVCPLCHQKIEKHLKIFDMRN